MSGRYWVEFWLNNLSAWFLTYLLYSTWLLGATALLVRLGRASAATENTLWRLSLGVVPLLAGARILVEHLEVPAAAVGPDAFALRGSLGWSLIGVSLASGAAALWLAGRFGRAVWSERHRLASRTPVREGWIVDELRALAAAAGQAPPRLTASARLRAPVAIGRHEICIPAGIVTRLSRSGARAVLAHELAHLRRGDTRWAGWVHLMERLFFLQPLQRWASRRLRETAEFLADDFAVRHSDGPEHLIDALTTFARSGHPGMATSGFAPGSLLLRRVQRVLRGASPPGRVPGVLLALLLAAVVAATWFSPAIVPACDCRLGSAAPWLQSLLGG